MSEIVKGMLVQHASLGVGKVVAVEATAVHVFFALSERRFAAKLRWPAASHLLSTEGVERNPWLEGLSSFALDAAEGRYALAANWMTHEQAIARFLADYPKGFDDPAYLGTASGARRVRAPRWRAASAEWAAALGDGQAERLVAARDAKELVSRAARVEKHLALVPGTFEPGTLKRALVDPDAALSFFAAVLEALSAAPARARMEKLFAAAEALDVEPALAWPIATVFPFVADPARHVLFWPRVGCAAAERLGCDLRYDPTPNWATYAALRTFSARLLEGLEEHGARDFVDVEAFLHATASRSADPGKNRQARRPAPGAAGARRTR